MSTGSGESNKPTYLVTGDLRYLMWQWAAKTEFHLPEKNFFRRLRADLNAELQRIFTPLGVGIRYEPYGEVKSKVLALLEEHANGTPVISLDRVYADNPDMFFNTTRITECIDPARPFGLDWEKNWRSIGNGPRPESLFVNEFYSIDDQIRIITLLDSIRFSEDKRVVVADDGIWSRQSLHSVEQRLAENGISVDKFVVGIKIEPGSDAKPGDFKTLNAPIINPDGYKFLSNLIFDWVCERDFYVGAPLSGRTIGYLDPKFESLAAAGDDPYPGIPATGNLSAPYVLPLGDPQHWGSIPSKEAVRFSVFCLLQALALYKAIEEKTFIVTGAKRQIQAKDLARVPVRYNSNPHRPITDWLKESLAELAPFV
jgi:hypothetical protein